MTTEIHLNREFAFSKNRQSVLIPFRFYSEFSQAFTELEKLWEKGYGKAGLIHESLLKDNSHGDKYLVFIFIGSSQDDLEYHLRKYSNIASSFTVEVDDKIELDVVYHGKVKLFDSQDFNVFKNANYSFFAIWFLWFLIMDIRTLVYVRSVSKSELGGHLIGATLLFILSSSLVRILFLLFPSIRKLHVVTKVFITLFCWIIVIVVWTWLFLIWLD